MCGKTRSEETRRKLSETRRRNIEKASQTIRCKAGRAGSGFKGVYKKRDLWQAKVNVNGRDLSVGCFTSASEAAHNYDYHVMKIYGEGVFTNFPEFDYAGFQPLKASPGGKTQRLNCKKVLKKKGAGVKKLSYEIACQIRALSAEGKSINQLAQQFEVTFASISRILHGVTYPPHKETATVTVIYNPTSV